MINQLTIKLVTSENDFCFDGWEEFVIEHPEGTIFHTPELYKIFERTKNYEPVFLSVNYDGKILGILLSVIQKEQTGFFGKFSARSIMMAAPIVKDNDNQILDFLIGKYNSIVKRRAIYTQIRNNNDHYIPYDTYKKYGYYLEPRLNIIIQLGKSESELWQQLDSKARNKIRKAQKSNIGVRQCEKIEEYKLFYKILKKTYNNIKLPLADFSFFENAFTILASSNRIVLLCAFHNEQMIGGRLCLVYKNKAIDWYAASLEEFYSYHPNDLLVWELLKLMNNKNCKIFDFGGAGKPDETYGVRDYKMKFGGELINTARVIKIHRPLLMEFGKAGLKIYKSL